MSARYPSTEEERRAREFLTRALRQIESDKTEPGHWTQEPPGRAGDYWIAHNYWHPAFNEVVRSHAYIVRVWPGLPSREETWGKLWAAQRVSPVSADERLVRPEMAWDALVQEGWWRWSKSADGPTDPLPDGAKTHRDPDNTPSATPTSLKRTSMIDRLTALFR